MKRRPSARLVILNAEGCALLFRYVFPDQVFWATPGGAVDDGETFERAAQRELLEETGFTQPVGPDVHQRRVEFAGPDGEWFDAEERYFLVRVTATELDTSGWEEEEAGIIQDYGWLSADEIEGLTEPVFPETFAELVRELTRDGGS
ncbi:MAG: NUDIX domain-containing protein [Pseudomonadota bacterium]